MAYNYVILAEPWRAWDGKGHAAHDANRWAK